ncbi:MAG TPA: MBOAT family protein [Thermodesulfobacteriota bacterium]|nr:MBOAT family protein [Thermodesulfobacteriota bacterium]
MLFNSYLFILLFLPVTLAVYFILNRQRLTTASKAWLVLCSLFFYGWWNVSYLPLILLSVIFNYAVGASFKRMRGGRRKSILVFGICLNLALLGYFKYMDFFIANLDRVSGLGVGLLHIVLPLGISFFTFTQIAFLVDSYRSEAHEYDFLNYALFVTFFPHLLAGPIIHHREMMPQFDRIRNKALDYRNISAGLFLFFIGLFKKVVLADSLSVWANAGFDYPGQHTLIEAWLTSLSYTLQLYFDFSGYTDMALGGALLFNIRLPVNFNSPYLALNIQDFWHRWHMTLSRFLRDYVYIPLGGNRVPEARVHLNLMVTFLVGGLWHGAGWTFVFWGFLHGVAMLVHRVWKRAGLSMPKAAAWFLTFNFLNLTWVFFRAKDMDGALRMLKGMAGLNGVALSMRLEESLGFLARYGVGFTGFGEGLHSGLIEVPEVLACLAAALLLKNSNEMVRGFRPGWKTLSFVIVIAFWSLLGMNTVREFLYFNF